MSLNQLMVVAGVGLIGCLTAANLFKNEVSKSLKSTPVNNEVLEKVRAHRGAVHFLGEPIETGSIKFNNMSASRDGYSEIKMNVVGPKSKGIVFYTIVEDELKKMLLKSIQLQIGRDDTKRLLIFDSKIEKPNNN